MNAPGLHEILKRLLQSSADQGVHLLIAEQAHPIEIAAALQREISLVDDHIVLDGEDGDRCRVLEARGNTLLKSWYGYLHQLASIHAERNLRAKKP